MRGRPRELEESVKGSDCNAKKTKGEEDEAQNVTKWLVVQSDRGTGTHMHIRAPSHTHTHTHTHTDRKAHGWTEQIKGRGTYGKKIGKL